MRINLEPLLCSIRESIQLHTLPDRPGAYARTLVGELKSNVYGCADVANIQYTLGNFERDPALRASAITELRSFQDPDSGLFQNLGDSIILHPIHTTAHCIASLELFDAAPAYQPKDLLKYLDTSRLEEFLAGLDWLKNPWSNSHQGAGVFVSLVLTGNATPAWKNFYFNWLDNHCDPEYGMGLRGAIQAGEDELSHHLFGWFHYLFNYLYARRPFPYAERLIDTCLTLHNEHRLPGHFGKAPGFMEIDWVFALNRAARQTGYRLDEAQVALREFAVEYIPALEKFHEANGFDNLHALFGTSTTLAELQLALPGELESNTPLKNVLDRRPFI